MLQNSLHRLPIGIRATVKVLEHKEATMRRRLLDIGFTQNAEVICLYESPSGDPRAYLIRDAVIALRKEDAQTIQVQYKKPYPSPPKKTRNLYTIHKKTRRDSIGSDKQLNRS